jgi:hypothetical protein
LNDEPITPTVAAVTVSGCHVIPVIRRCGVSLAKVRIRFAPVPGQLSAPALNNQVKPTSTPPPGAAAPGIAKYTGVLAAAGIEIFPATTTSAIM